MAKIRLVADHIEVALGVFEKLGAARGNLKIPLKHVTSATVSANPFDAVMGLRWFGAGIPFVFGVGLWKNSQDGRSFVAVYRGTPAIVLELCNERYDRLVVSTPDAEELKAALLPTKSDGKPLSYR